MSTVTIPINTKTLEGYNLFVQCKRLPVYKVVGSSIQTDEKSYNYVFGDNQNKKIVHKKHSIEFDYQEYVINKALEREKYAAFLDCGLGKTIIELMYVHDAIGAYGGKGLILCPLSVLEDIQRECNRLYGYRMSNLRREEWKTDIAIVNYENRKEIDKKNITAIVLDESSILKSGDGEICQYIMQLMINVPYRLACSATPSPNDQTEYASHAVALGLSNTLKEFYSKFFVKDGTQWRMKHHAKDAFYDYLKSWCCYIQSPSSIGFEKGAELDSEPNYILQESYIDGDYYKNGKFLSDGIDLNLSRKIFGELRSNKNTERFNVACNAASSTKGIVWCSRNSEEKAFQSELKCPVINGQTELEKRVEIVDAFKSGDLKNIISKPSVLGFGVNIQEAEAHVFSGYTFSFEQFYQAVRRSHRYGRLGSLDVYVPVSEPERPIWDLLNAKLKTFRQDVIELQGRFFK
jgi:superfamily II DNA or RNA helicase